ncbi:MAG: hypothetical protein ACR2NP_12285 [Pirellulaceae bacterium]
MSDVFETAELPDNIEQSSFELWDSVQHLNLIVELEQKFSVDFEPEEIAEMTSLERIESTIRAKVA